MHTIIRLSAISFLAAGCAAKTAPVEPAAAPEAEAAEAEAPAEAPAPTSSATAAADAKWMPVNPEKPGGPHMSVVTGNPKEGAFLGLAKFPAGLSMPLHSHPADFAGLVLSGTVQTGRSMEDYEDVGAGSLWTEPANAVHITGCAEGSDCVFVAHFDGAMGITPAEAPAEGELLLTFTAGSDFDYKPVNPDKPEGAQMAIVAGDMATGPFQAVVKFPAGATSPEHTHTPTYSAVVVSGTMTQGGSDPLEAGSFWTTVGGDAHTTGCISEEPCVFFASMDGAFDMTPTAAPAEEPAEAPAE